MSEEKLNSSKEEDLKLKKNKIIPSYIKNNIGENKVDKKIKTKEKHIKSKVTLLVLFILVLALIFGIYKLFNFIRFISYSDYEKKMDIYGFSNLYNNKKATSSDVVTKAEAIKLILAATLNKNDITEYVNSTTNNSDINKAQELGDNYNYAYIEKIDSENEENNSDEEFVDNTKYVEKYKDSAWIDYAVSKEIITNDDINQQNKDEKATYIDVLRYLSNSKNIVLGKKLDTSVTPDFKDYSSYNLNEQYALSDLVVNSIIDNSSKKINGNRKIYKGELNKLIVTYIQKYNTITINDEKLNINKEKEPSNASNYPYILANVDKSIYEKEDYIKDKSKYKNALKTYYDLKNNYYEINEIITVYFNKILNINYNELTDEKIEQIKYDLQVMSDYYNTIEQFNKYIEYVKSNKIVITGSANVELPAVYFDGENYRVRTKIEYVVQNATDFKNLIFKDMSLSDVQSYTKNKTEMILDVPINKEEDTGRFYVITQPISNIISGQVK
jgi:hypothetical protein